MGERVLSNPVTARADLTTEKELRISGGVIESGVLDLGILTTGDFVTPNDLTGVGIIVFRTGNDITFRSWGSADQVFDGATNAHRRLLLVVQAGSGSCTLGSGFSNGVVLRVGQMAEIWCDPYVTAPSWRVVSRDITTDVQALLAGYATEAYADSGDAATLAAALAADITYTDTGIVITGGARGGTAIDTSLTANHVSSMAPAGYAYPTGGTDWQLWVDPVPASGTFTLDVRKRAFGNTAPSGGDSICAAAFPSLAGNASDFTETGDLSTWTASPIAKGDMLTVAPTVNTALVTWWCLFIPARRAF